MLWDFILASDRINVNTSLRHTVENVYIEYCSQQGLRDPHGKQTETKSRGRGKERANVSAESDFRIHSPVTTNSGCGSQSMQPMFFYCASV